jgi:hypothetical protein
LGCDYVCLDLKKNPPDYMWKQLKKKQNLFQCFLAYEIRQSSTEIKEQWNEISTKQHIITCQLQTKSSVIKHLVPPERIVT